MFKPKNSYDNFFLLEQFIFTKKNLTSFSTKEILTKNIFLSKKFSTQKKNFSPKKLFSILIFLLKISIDPKKNFYQNFFFTKKDFLNKKIFLTQKNSSPSEFGTTLPQLFFVIKLLLPFLMLFFESVV